MQKTAKKQKKKDQSDDNNINLTNRLGQGESTVSTEIQFLQKNSNFQHHIQSTYLTVHLLVCSFCLPKYSFIH